MAVSHYRRLAFQRSMIRSLRCSAARTRTQLLAGGMASSPTVWPETVNRVQLDQVSD